MKPTLHIRCGSDIRAKLQLVGIPGAFLEVSNPYCLGPVPRDGDLLAVRATFLSEAFDIAPPDATARLKAEYEALANAAGNAERIVLWFEHDSYDQLILACVLASLAQQHPVPTKLVCIDRYPAVARFIGLGQLPAEAFPGLFANRGPIGPEHYRLGTAVWDALRDPSPLALHAIAAAGTPAIPLMAAALHRHLQELPWTADGLSLTQRLVLQGLQDGPRTVAELFAFLTEQTEPLPFLGDLMFWWIVRTLTPAVRMDPTTEMQPWPTRLLSLTPTGEALLAGRADWLDQQQAVRWVGGVRIVSGQAGWRWNAELQCPVWV